MGDDLGNSSRPPSGRRGDGKSGRHTLRRRDSDFIYGEIGDNRLTMSCGAQIWHRESRSILMPKAANLIDVSEGLNYGPSTPAGVGAGAMIPPSSSFQPILSFFSFQRLVDQI